MAKTHLSRSTSFSDRAGHSPNKALLYQGSRVLLTLRPEEQDQEPVKPVRREHQIR